MLNTLFFLLQNNKQLKRQIEMLKFLNTSSEGISSYELATHLGCTKPTVYDDIKLLNAEFSKNIQITKKGSNGYILLLPEDQSIETFIVQLIQKTSVYQIIDNIFHNRIYSMQEAEDTLFISKAVLRRTINYMNHVLQDFNIHISTVKIDLVGDESHIRLFLFHFYSGLRNYPVTNNHGVVPITSNQSLLNSILEDDLQHLNYNYFRTMIWIDVIKERISHQHFATVPQELIQELSYNIHFHKKNESYKKILKKVFNIENLSINESVWIYIATLYCISYAKLHYGTYENSRITYKRTNLPQFTKKIERFLEPIFPIEVIQNGEIDNIKAYLINLYFLSKITPLFQYISPYLKEYIKENYSERYSLWHTVLQKNTENELFDLFPIKYIEEIACSLTMLHTSIICNKTLKPLRVLLSFNGEMGFEDILYRECKLLFTDNVEVEYLVDKAITEEKLKTLNIDLIVCNYELPEQIKPTCQVFSLSYLPKKSEWSILRDKIISLSKYDTL